MCIYMRVNTHHVRSYLAGIAACDNYSVVSAFLQPGIFFFFVGRRFCFPFPYNTQTSCGDISATTRPLLFPGRCRAFLKVPWVRRYRRWNLGCVTRGLFFLLNLGRTPENRCKRMPGCCYFPPENQWMEGYCEDCCALILIAQLQPPIPPRPRAPGERTAPRSKEQDLVFRKRCRAFLRIA